MKKSAVLIILHLTVLATLTAEAIAPRDLKGFLESQRARKIPDRQMARYLRSLTVSERISDALLVEMSAKSKLGPMSTLQLRLLTDSSQFLKPSADETLDLPAPTPSTQQEIISSATHYVSSTLRHLPDFIATRQTQSFDDSFEDRWFDQESRNHLWHFTGSSHKDVVYRSGFETADSFPDRSDAPADPDDMMNGLTTSGEFGPVLTVLLTDSFAGNLQWSHWQKLANGSQIAVFDYKVSKDHSQYSIQFCCHWMSPSGEWEYRFGLKAAYHGAVGIDPVSGAIYCFTLVAEMGDQDPLASVSIAVFYDSISIRGENFICPSRSIAISVLRESVVYSPDNPEFEEHLNEVNFSNYRKFGSESLLINDRL